jgi:hypothetical protein
MVENSYLGRALKCCLTHCGCIKTRLFDIRQLTKVVRNSAPVKWLESLCEYFLICKYVSVLHVNKTYHLNSTNTSLYSRENSKLILVTYILGNSSLYQEPTCVDKLFVFFFIFSLHTNRIIAILR